MLIAPENDAAQHEKPAMLKREAMPAVAAPHYAAFLLMLASWRELKKNGITIFAPPKVPRRYAAYHRVRAGVIIDGA